MVRGCSAHGTKAVQFNNSPHFATDASSSKSGEVKQLILPRVTNSHCLHNAFNEESKKLPTISDRLRFFNVEEQDLNKKNIHLIFNSLIQNVVLFHFFYYL